MRTMFQMGFSPAPFFLGQQSLTDDEKTALYDQLVDTEGKLDIVAEWKKNHPNVDADLEGDGPRFHSLETHLKSVEPVAKDVMKRVGAVDPVQLTINELNQTKDWMSDAHQMFIIVANHTGKKTPAPVTLPAPTAPAINPVALGIGAAGLLILAIVALK